MQMLFSSADITEIGRVGRQFVEAGIPCGVRYEPPREGTCPAPAHAELWVQSKDDFYRALLLYLRHEPVLANQEGHLADKSVSGASQTRREGETP
jgi:hypothetical protein